MPKPKGKEHLKWSEIKKHLADRHYPVEYTDDEVWRLIVGFGIVPEYEISNHGRVRRACDGYNGNAGDLLSPCPMPHGGMVISLRVSNAGVRKSKIFAVHRLVAFAFDVPNHSEVNDVVNHKDGNRQNNHPDNLEWTDDRGNVLHAYAHGLIPVEEDHYRCKLSREQVTEIKQRLAAGEGIMPLSKEFGVNSGTIHCIQYERTWKSVPWPEGFDPPTADSTRE